MPVVEHPAQQTDVWEWEKEWYACSQPERPWDDYAAYYGPCPRCRLAFRAAIVNGVDPQHGVDLRTLRDPYGRQAWTFQQAAMYMDGFAHGRGES